MGRPDVWSIGHSNLSEEQFLTRLRENAVQIVADVRSQPYSRYTPHFTRETLQERLEAEKIHYVFLGDELGGRPQGGGFYDSEGRVLYSKVAAAPFFREGLERLLLWGRRYRVAMLCSEGDPKKCHRRLLVARVLREKGVDVAHVLPSGEVVAESELVEEEGRLRQATLFSSTEDAEWKSPQSVLQKNPRKNSSND